MDSEKEEKRKREKRIFDKKHSAKAEAHYYRALSMGPNIVTPEIGKHEPKTGSLKLRTRRPSSAGGGAVIKLPNSNADDICLDKHFPADDAGPNRRHTCLEERPVPAVDSPPVLYPRQQHKKDTNELTRRIFARPDSAWPDGTRPASMGGAFYVNVPVNNGLKSSPPRQALGLTLTPSQQSLEAFKSKSLARNIPPPDASQHDLFMSTPPPASPSKRIDMFMATPPPASGGSKHSALYAGRAGQGRTAESSSPSKSLYVAFILCVIIYCYNLFQYTIEIED